MPDILASLFFYAWTEELGAGAISWRMPEPLFSWLYAWHAATMSALRQAAFCCLE